MDVGCELGFGPDCETGWPSYMIDHSAVKNRMMGFASYLYAMYGELYWSVNFAAATGGDPWVTQWFAGGNGDGTLTYRGTVDRVGGLHEIPIASIRLKQVRPRSP